LSAGSPDEYESALNSIRLENESNPVPGDRTASLTVTDADGIRSDAATITVSILDPVDDGGRGGDTLVGTGSFDALAGRDGDDTIFGRGRADFLDGGDGDDRLFGEGGDDILVGGPGQDQLTGGPGADRYVFTSLGDGRDTILDFNAEEGDRLDLRQLFQGAGFDPGAADAGDFLRFDAVDGGGGDAPRVGVVVDLDGAGDTHVAAQVATLVNPVGVAPGTAVADVTTFTGSDGATA
jgi:large repetitive protein